MGTTSHIQPYIEFSKSIFAVGTWGSYGVTGTEADLYVTISPVEAFSFTVTDYFFPNEVVNRNKYFNYNNTTTSHTLEAMLRFNGTDRIPVYGFFAMNFYGADAINLQGNKVLSKYLELGYTTEINKVNLDFFCGAALDDPDEEKGEGIGFYGQYSLGIINLGLTASKKIKMTDSFSPPINASLILNPEAENLFIVFGISF